MKSVSSCTSDIMVWPVAVWRHVLLQSLEFAASSMILFKIKGTVTSSIAEDNGTGGQLIRLR
ncbi:hypothetical protein ACP70R_018214 [Stipagrostis hirtigluma subsp. patula]